MKIFVAFITKGVYDIKCCDVIAVKREVAGKEISEPGFSAERMSSYKTDDKSLYHYSLPQAETTCGLQRNRGQGFVRVSG